MDDHRELTPLDPKLPTSERATMMVRRFRVIGKMALDNLDFDTADALAEAIKDAEDLLAEIDGKSDRQQLHSD